MLNLGINSLDGNSIAEMASYVATPVARQILRLVRSESGTSDEFSAASYLFEALLKYETICSLAILEYFDKNEATALGYRLVRDESLGLWRETLRKSLSSMTASGSNETMQFTRRFSQAFNQLEAQAVADRAHVICCVIGQINLCLTKTRLGLMEFFIALRNRTRAHGAILQRTFESINGPVIQLLERLLRDSPYLQQPLIKPVKLKKGDQFACRVLAGIAPQEHIGLDSTIITQSKSLYLNISGGIYVPVPDLAKYHHDDDGCLFLNGAPRKTGLSEFIDYFTARTQQIEVQSYPSLPLRSPKSSTAGAVELAIDSFPIHNLPKIDFLNYVQRVNLESQLLELLQGRTTNIISLGGEGGIGKTTLALRVARSLALTGAENDDSPFEYMIWFSARDVDLLDIGPAARDRQVTSLESCARLFRSMIEPFEPMADVRSDLDFFALALRAGSPRFLLIFDNFESFDDVAQLQDFLRENLAFPSKVLATSRERNFEGDRQIRVPGLSLEQSRDLIARTARQVGCEPSVLDEMRVVAITSGTNGNPYAMKLVVNELANGTPFEQIFTRALNERYLTTLFRRSFERVDEAAQYVFFMIALCAPARQENVVKLACVGRVFDYERARETLIRHSLLDSPTRQDDGRFIFRVSWAAQEFARSVVTGTANERSVFEDRSFFTELAQAGVLASSAEVVAYIDGKFASGLFNPLDSDRGRRIIDFLVASDAETAAARALRVLNDPKLTAAEKRAAFKNAVEQDPSSSSLWYSWSLLEERERQYMRGVELALRAVDFGDSVEALQRVGKLMIRLITSANEQIPSGKRRQYTSSITERLELVRDQLGSDGLGTLGWLYLISSQMSEARSAAKAAVAHDSMDQRAQDLCRRCGLRI